MISALYVVLAAVHVLVWSWGLRAWRRTGRPLALLLVLVPAALLWYDNLRIGLGRLVGEGSLGCIGDAIRYTATLSPAYLCGPDDVVHRVGPGPVVAILMNVVVLAVGVALWARRGWPWLAASAGAMFVAAAGGPAWGTYAPPVANVGEVVFVVGLIATAGRFGARAAAGGPRGSRAGEPLPPGAQRP